MKKSLSTIAFLTLSLTLLAGPVGQDRALRAARGFFGETKASDLTLVWDGEDAKTKAVGESPAFYVYNRTGGGFVIISGDDKVKPVLGYSLSGQFVTEGMPANISHWMSDVRAAVLKARSDRSISAFNGWEGAAGSQAKPVVTYETALWNQLAPYNALCPKIYGDPTYTGCVATAIAILMRYYSWPDAGTGTLPGYQYQDRNKNTQKISGYALDHSYNWDQMPLTDLKKGASEEQKAQVAQLIYDCAVMMEMHFDTDGSSAIQADVVTQLPRHMKYDAGISMEQARHFNAVSWVALLKKGLDSGPLLYDGQSDKGGHAFVIAGYDSADRFYINWGWGGQGNGYFEYPGFSDYKTDNSAYLWVRPDKGSKAEPKLSVDSMSSSTAKYSKGTTFTLTAKGVWNYGAGDFNGMIAAGKLGTDNKVDIISTAKNTRGLHFRYGWTEMTFGCRIETDIKAGDKIGVFYQLEGETQWRSVLYDVEKGGGMISVDGLDDMMAGTSIVYTVSPRSLKVTSLQHVTISLEKPDGTVVSSGKGELKIDAPQKGSYLLGLSTGSLKNTVEVVL